MPRTHDLRCQCPCSCPIRSFPNYATFILILLAIGSVTLIGLSAFLPSEHFVALFGLFLTTLIRPYVVFGLGAVTVLCVLVATAVFGEYQLEYTFFEVDESESSSDPDSSLRRM